MQQSLHTSPFTEYFPAIESGSGLPEQGWDGLAAELALDVARLWARNLGRDDRLLADTGREARHPFRSRPPLTNTKTP